ncbi:MAG TPA: methyltransferase domain-containing protein [Pyrinomonadaceae bacterium]|nr:methyltransferase domain-containing protein [Pyrinomonadaceae bacterium]
MIENPEFDKYAETYDAALARSLSPTGEDKNYFARGRLRRLAAELKRRGASARSVLDFGCGTGSAAPHIADGLRPERIVGVDVSPKSLEVARREHAATGAEFRLLDDYEPEAEFDLAYTNGVFHHIPVGERARAVAYVLRALRPGGLLAFWENNPWNPGTRYTMSRNEFDADAVMLSPPEARRLLAAGGFQLLRSESLFYFPRQLAFLRWAEPYLARLPLGGQYLVLCRKPDDARPRP